MTNDQIAGPGAKKQKFNAAVNDRIQELAVKSIKNGSIQSREMNDLISLLTPKLRFYIWGFLSNEEDTDDVLQNTLEKICLGFEGYDPAYRFTTWAYTIAKNEALGWNLRIPSNKIDLNDNFNVVAESILDNRTEILYKEQYREMVLVSVYDEIQKCAMEEGNLMFLEKDINKRKTKDIAIHYGINENTVKTRVKAGRKRVRDKMYEKYPELRGRRINFGL